jgi:hypothetical protein
MAPSDGMTRINPVYHTAAGYSLARDPSAKALSIGG